MLVAAQPKRITSGSVSGTMDEKQDSKVMKKDTNPERSG